MSGGPSRAMSRRSSSVRASGSKRSTTGAAGSACGGACGAEVTVGAVSAVAGAGGGSELERPLPESGTERSGRGAGAVRASIMVV